MDVVARANAAARQTVVLLSAAALLVIGLLALQVLRFADAHGRAAEDLASAQRLAGEILLADERLTMSAFLAAATGDLSWAGRYDDTLPAIDAAIAGAMALASPAARADFDAATRQSNDRLVAMEREAFAAVREGRTHDAGEILRSPGYGWDKELLAGGTTRFVATLVEERRAAMADLVRRAKAELATSGALAGTGFLVLWLRLRRRLRRSTDAHEQAISEIARLASHDTLTGLPNRRALAEALARATARADRSGERLAVMVVDLDRFKPINDRLGHLAGDAVLVEVAKRLRAVVREHELVARMGGDEFVVLVERPDAGAPARVAERLVAAVSRPIDLGDHEVEVGASVGLAIYPDDARSPDDLLRKADVALYRAKDTGRGTTCSFDVTMDEAVRERAELEAELRHAVTRGQVTALFQPQVDAVTGEIVAFEALARWRHPTRGLILPDRFLPAAEQGGLMAELTTAVLREGMLAARDWPERVRLAVNLSPRQLGDRELPTRVARLAEECGFAPSRLTIELTEDALVADLDAARATLGRLKALGARIELDDFGTGYSSVSHLAELPIDGIKLDRRFARTLAGRAEQANVVGAVIALARGLGLTTTIEGIEAPAMLERARELGCTLVQGFLLAQPMDASAAARLTGTSPETWNATGGPADGASDARPAARAATGATSPGDAGQAAPAVA